MEESGSEGLDELIFAQKDKFFKDVDYVCISDNYWLGKNKPCITYGLRGICYFFIEVQAESHKLHLVSLIPLFFCTLTRANTKKLIIHEGGAQSFPGPLLVLHNLS